MKTGVIRANQSCIPSKKDGFLDGYWTKFMAQETKVGSLCTRPHNQPSFWCWKMPSSKHQVIFLSRIVHLSLLSYKHPYLYSTQNSHIHQKQHSNQTWTVCHQPCLIAHLEMIFQPAGHSNFQPYSPDINESGAMSIHVHS